MLTPLQTLKSFAFRLSSIKVSGDEEPRDASLAPLLSGSLDSCSSTLAIPCLWLERPPEEHSSFSPNSAFDDLRVLYWMSQPVVVKKCNVGRVPWVLLNSFTSSFIAIVQQRRRRVVRNSKEFLLSNNSPGRNRTIRLATLEALSKPSIFKISAVITRCRTLSSSRGHIIQEGTSMSGRQVQLPLNFSVEVNLIILNQQKVNIVISTSGTIRGMFVPGQPNRLEDVELQLDTVALYKSMKQRAVDLIELADSVAKRQQVAGRSAKRLAQVTRSEQCASDTSSLTRSGMVGNQDEKLSVGAVRSKKYALHSPPCTISGMGENQNEKPLVKSARCA